MWSQDGHMQLGDQVMCVNGPILLDWSNSKPMPVLKSALTQIKPGINSPTNNVNNYIEYKISIQIWLAIILKNMM